MAKKKTVFICSACGSEHAKWLGRCPQCGEWNSIAEAEAARDKGGPPARAVSLSSLALSDLKRIKTGIEEYNIVCGGGMVPGSVVLVGGEPGIGKSTLAIQIAASFKTLYVSGEESPLQIRSRAERLGVDFGHILFSSNTVVDDIVQLVGDEKPECLIIDSVQTLSTQGIPGAAGSVSQIRESAAAIVSMAKRADIPVILIGHITKDGAIAGPKLLEHIVDTVLYFEGDFLKEYRILRAVKNRFGSVNEVGLFRMTAEGLQEVKDKNSLFINPFSTQSSGHAVSAAVEGSRTILFEVQSLVSFTTFSNPRRMADGFDLNRLILLIAVLEKHALLKLGGFDVFVNVAGGFRIQETAADLAVAMAIASSLKEKPVSPDIGFIAEISLSGELRPVPQCQRRVQEFGRSGFRSVVIAKPDKSEGICPGFSGEIIGLSTIGEAVDYIF